MTGRLHVRNGKYVVILNVKDEATGKYKPKWIPTGLPEKGNKRKAEQMLAEALASYTDIVHTESAPQGKSMSDAVSEWLETAKGTVRANSYQNYEEIARIHVIPYFEILGLSVQEIKPVHIQKYYNLKYANGLSASTLEKHRSVIRGTFMHARDLLEIIETIPSDRAKLPKNEITPPDYYTEQELERLFKVTDGKSIESAVRLCATYGFRRSEVLGLKWDAVDFDRKTVVVRRSVVREGSKSVEKQTVKKQASYRTMPLIPVMETYLRQLQSQQKKDKKLCGKSYQDSDFICRREDGSLLEPNNVSFRFRTIVKQAVEDKALDKYIKFHGLRHSAASVLVNHGCSLKEVQAWLGHATIRSTERYAHLEYSTLVQAGNVVNGVFDKGN